MTQDELTELATLYYVDNHTQEALAKRFGISRATVSRMLRKAQEEGVVEIRVRQHPAYANGLEQELRQRFGIQRAIIAIDHQDGDKQRALLAAQVAAYLDQTLDDGMVVAVGMGRNISAVSDYISTPARRECAFISAIGGAYRGGETMNSDHICRRLAARFGGESETLYAPALIRDPALRQSLLENDTVRQTLDRARRADLALIGIGDLSEDSNIVRMGWFSPTEIAEAKRSGAIGDVMGYDFFDIYGQPAGTPLQGRIVGLHLGDLERIPNVVAIASEQSKATALLGALRTGVIDTLATTTVNAMTVISLDDITRKTLAV
ncbi:DNA-binding protein [Chromobacterium sp. LK11]|uniref:sugar-binding transcriptional regulator n=1 Tax=Chromobacterium sp. LK11 TaxID=1628212 RepID=UPI0006538315|nr:sugar-binding transcriptional regulator [Chromobacterium sp. LK11]KMN76611.1 DNA-binding protein [Chromobacterium sp. LK11]